MAYDAMANLTHGDVVTETEWDKVNTNFTWLASLRGNGAVLSTLADGDNISALVTGTYSGDGAATQGVTGLAFQPVGIYVYSQTGDGPKMGWKTDQDGLNTRAATGTYTTDHIISLDADGFTVGDGTGDVNRFNAGGTAYTYIAWG